MDVFEFRDRLIDEYQRFTRSFVRIRAPDIAAYVDGAYGAGRFWPAPMVGLNPAFVPGGEIGRFVAEGVLHPECERIFRFGKTADGAPGSPLTLHRHQEEAIRIAKRRESYVLTTGTGSGKSLSYFVPIVDDVLRRKAAGQTTALTAIVVYPMNALCNSQMEELQKYLCLGYPDGNQPVTFARYTGQEGEEARQRLAATPPDILLTNYVMLELMLTRHSSPDPQVVAQAKGLRFLVLDELHTYRGRQGADVAMLVRRVRDRTNPGLLCVGTSATMATGGTATDRANAVASVATRLFGAKVKPENIVTETLQRVTDDTAAIDRAALAAAIAAGVPEVATHETLRSDPVAAWVETTLGLAREDDRPEGRWVRTSRPKTLQEAAGLLASASGRDEAECLDHIRRLLLLAYRTPDPAGRPLFAFRLHQFVAGAGDVFTTLEPPGLRYLTLNGQQYQPGTERKPLFTAVFCRSCGQEYLPVWATVAERRPVHLAPREFGDRNADEEGGTVHGYFMPDPEGEFDADDPDRYPDDWLEPAGDGTQRLRQNFRQNRPVAFRAGQDGGADERGLSGWFVPKSFRFCLNRECDAVFDGSVRSETAKLGSLSAEGRSSATTVLTIAAMRHLLGEASLPKSARKLLGFTDNRQDASLQAGHLNDFVLVLLLRGALLAALRDQPDGTLTDDVLTHKVLEHLRLTPPDYASTPDAKGAKAEAAKKALRDVLGYRLYFDLRRGWRFTHPNLEQLDFLRIGYLSLNDCAADQAEWTKRHPLLARASAETRLMLLRDLLDRMRRGLAIKTIYLDGNHLEQVRNRSFNELREPWGMAEDERPVVASAMVPRPQPPTGRLPVPIIHVSHRSAFGRQIKAKNSWGTAAEAVPGKIDEDAYNRIVDDMLSVLATYGLAEAVDVEGGHTGWRVPASVIEWRIGDGSEGESDNTFFRGLYDNVAEMLRGDDRFLHALQAREHTAQVDADERERREERFRSAELPVLFCSPTMELGVDIATLNTVYLRNVPPTPANYAQRSGRAGRSGQPALVLTYCAARSPHDQYFFRDPARMVAGAVNPPALDLANEDLIRSHLNAVWLGETGQKLGPSVQDVLDKEKQPDLPLLPSIAAQVDQPAVRQRAAARGISILGSLRDELTPDRAPWFTADWLDHAIKSAHLKLDAAFDRWRTLFNAAQRQMDLAHAVQMNAAADQKTRDEAKARYNEARVQRDLLLDNRATMSSDFYCYRYLASEGFLPGYNFPRLPLLAFIPARREKIGRDSFLSRPRFLGLAEFGPRSIIYHEGSTYRVRKAILTVSDTESVSTSARLTTRRAKLCPTCGYGHFDVEADHELCVNCGARLEGGMPALLDLHRIDQVSTKRADRITSDEEERQRQGYEVVTTLRFAESDGQRRHTPVNYREGGEMLLNANYGPAATVWRINLGWRRRKNKSIFGFNIDVASGEWSRDEQAPDEAMDDAPTAKTVQRIIPFVEDRRNVLVVRPAVNLDADEITTLTYALKRGIEGVFQLEESELAAEPLPDRENRNAILLYEAAEGGAGVLSRLVSDPDTIRRVAIRALEVAHWRSKSGLWSDVSDLEDTDPECEAGCYKCLLSYANQPDHGRIDRKGQAVLGLLCRLARADAEAGTAAGAGARDAFDELLRQCGSELERAWLAAVRDGGFRLPDRAQPLLAEFSVRPDFAYDSTKALIFVDGPHHQADTTMAMDDAKRRALRDAGYKVIAFAQHKADWPAVFTKFPFVFGKGRA
jgi:superfamily II DNA/RNA helicase/very-short-patch-repair endonuclease